MKITIHRGTNQIGGCITEIESDGYKVFIDFGEQLPGSESEKLPLIEGLTKGDVSKSILLITHYHGDHVGKISETISDLPIYMGKTALEIFKHFETRMSYNRDTNIADKHHKNLERVVNVRTFEALQLIKFGSITITPLFVDHSAFDAYMFVIESNGKKVLHTGDFRGHGFRSKGLLPTLRTYATNIDYLITEGTNINSPNVTLVSELDLKQNFTEQFRKHKYNFVFVSSTNIDRIFGLYHAAKTAKRCFVCDDYQGGMLEIVSNNQEKYSSFYDIDYENIVTPAGRIIALNCRNGEDFSFKGKLKPYLERHGFCMLIRTNEAYKPLLNEYMKMDETKIYYSMWDGYLDNSRSAFNEKLYNFFEPYDIEHIHTSGHTDIKTLKEVFETVRPKRGIIPIHTENPERFLAIFENQTIILLKDGKTLDCVN